MRTPLNTSISMFYNCINEEMINADCNSWPFNADCTLSRARTDTVVHAYLNCNEQHVHDRPAEFQQCHAAAPDTLCGCLGLVGRTRRRSVLLLILLNTPASNH